LTLVDQAVSIEPDQPWTITLGLPAGLDSSTLGAAADTTTDVVVTVHRAMRRRQDFDAARAGQLPRADDSVDVSLEPDVADARVTRPDRDRLTLTIPTESSQRTPDALQFPAAGVHAVVVEIRVDGEVLAETTTYVHRRAQPGDTFGEMSVALVMNPVSDGAASPVVGEDGTILVGADLEAAYERLASALEALTTDFGRVPTGLTLQPEVLRRLVEDRPALGNRLVPLLDGAELFAATRLPLDPSTAVRNDRTDNYVTLLREGEDLLRALAPNAVVTRSTMTADGTLAASGAQLRRDLATETLILDFDTYADLDGTTGLLTDTTQMITVALPDGGSLRASVPDPYLSEVLDADHRGPRAQPFRAAVDLIAELLVIAGQVDADGQDVDRHGIALARSDGGVPDAELLAPLARLLTTTPGLRPSTPTELARSTFSWLLGGLPVTVQLPAAGGIDQSDRYELVDSILVDAVTWASVLPAGDPLPTSWFERIAATASTAMDDETVTRIADVVADDFVAIAGSIVAPEPFRFTLTGTRQPITFKIRNDSTEPRIVRIRLESAKVRFPQGDLVRELAPGDTEIVVDAEALSNGSSSVFLRIFAPDPSRDVELVPETVLTARVNSLAGVGQLLTGAGLLVVATWWFTSWRTGRQRRRAAEHLQRHPSNGSNDADRSPEQATIEPSDTPGDSEHEHGPGDEPNTAPAGTVP
jgi:hypothetical protein